jgi:hypothetical protein
MLGKPITFRIRIAALRAVPLALALACASAQAVVTDGPPRLPGSSTLEDHDIDGLIGSVREHPINTDRGDVFEQIKNDPLIRPKLLAIDAPPVAASRDSLIATERKFLEVFNLIFSSDKQYALRIPVIPSGDPDAEARQIIEQFKKVMPPGLAAKLSPGDGVGADEIGTINKAASHALVYAFQLARLKAIDDLRKNSSPPGVALAESAQKVIAFANLAGIGNLRNAGTQMVKKNGDRIVPDYDKIRLAISQVMGWSQQIFHKTFYDASGAVVEPGNVKFINTVIAPAEFASLAAYRSDVPGKVDPRTGIPKNVTPPYAFFNNPAQIALAKEIVSVKRSINRDQNINPDNPIDGNPAMQRPNPTRPGESPGSAKPGEGKGAGEGKGWGEGAGKGKGEGKGGGGSGGGKGGGGGGGGPPGHAKNPGVKPPEIPSPGTISKLDLEKAMIRDVEMRGLAEAIGPRRTRRNPDQDPVKGITDQLASMAKDRVAFMSQLPRILAKGFTGVKAGLQRQFNSDRVQAQAGQPRPITGTVNTPGGRYVTGPGTVGNPIAAAQGATRMLAAARGRSGSFNGTFTEPGPEIQGSGGIARLNPRYRDMATYLRDHPNALARGPAPAGRGAIH